MRTTVTVSAKTGAQRIHLKKNYQYNLRGSKFSIPDAKPGRAKGQQKAGTGLILREDQAEWQDAVRSEKIRREKEERKVAKGTLDGWNDPDVSVSLPCNSQFFGVENGLAHLSGCLRSSPSVCRVKAAVEATTCLPSVMVAKTPTRLVASDEHELYTLLCRPFTCIITCTSVNIDSDLRHLPTDDESAPHSLYHSSPSRHETDCFSAPRFCGCSSLTWSRSSLAQNDSFKLDSNQLQRLQGLAMG